MKEHFPDGFLWGASTASHQVEGGTINQWSEWETSPSRRAALQSDGRTETYGFDNYVSGRACDHYNRYKEDFELAKSLGHNATRFSIEWSRIEPLEGQFSEEGLAHYRDVIATLNAIGIKPFVTLWHWTLPVWLAKKGGWESPDCPKLFARYAARVAEALPGVQFWITINEPEIYTAQSYHQGIWPPQIKSAARTFNVIHALIDGHKQAYAAIKKTNPSAHIGIAKNNIHFDPDPPNIINRARAAWASYWWNDYFLNRIRNHQDFIGLNHYFHNRVHGGKLGQNKNEVTNDMGWELWPASIYGVLMGLQKYKKPVYITEHGLADADDSRRPWFLVESLRFVREAIKAGVPVKGYLHWSLMDNFEWDKGFWPQFGLIHIDRATLARIPRPSAYLYKTICETNALPDVSV